MSSYDAMKTALLAAMVSGLVTAAHAHGNNQHKAAAHGAHGAMMKKHPNMEHDEPHMAHVGPKKAGQLIWQFNREGDFDFACLIAGHYEAGMVGKIRVTP